jgi:hypothetical protein
MLSNALLLFSWLATLVALVLVALGFRGRTHVVRGRCGGCGQELHDPLPKRCGECGAELERKDGISWGRPAIAVRPLLAGLVAGVLAVVTLVLIRQSRINAQWTTVSP